STARQIVYFTYQKDSASRKSGISVQAVRAGCAGARMAVSADMLNAFDFCHGGGMAALADTALAYACLSQRDVAGRTGLLIEFSRCAACGDVLEAEANEIHSSKNTRLFDIVIKNQSADTVLLARGKVRRYIGTRVLELDK